ncbi:activator of Hsp90 ATPase 1 family protein [Rhodococcus sp. RS1C4]|nr:MULTISPECIES: SRPBCC domain-containing protein [unclassified Rhodococcus (in: high G+C Gram-positive bacteria)]OZC58865.1 activator of Hsp90 ATPase 1 family protein [Rhodococcus sp. RS1C4]OZD64502.1 activator of Hsp90 ATPase 1 family protein [Rhodococcus sp. 06-1059B-a]
MSPVGKTKDAGWEIGVSKTLPFTVDQVWAALVDSPDLWLGSGAKIPHSKGEPWSAEDGTTGELRSRTHFDRVRLTWRPATWSHDSTVQVAVRASGERTMVRFHQERLADAEEREMQRIHWTQVLTRVERALQG